jgi:hypothetical protein
MSELLAVDGANSRNYASSGAFPDHHYGLNRHVHEHSSGRYRVWARKLGALGFDAEHLRRGGAFVCYFFVLDNGAKSPALKLR